MVSEHFFKTSAFFTVVLLTLSACNFNGREEQPKEAADSTDHWGRTLQEYSFTSTEAVIKNKGVCSWASGKEAKNSVTLFFDATNPRKVCLTFPKGHAYLFSFRYDPNKIEVLWDPTVQNHEDPQLSGIFNKIHKTSFGKVFMELHLKNDSLLRAVYPLAEVQELLNGSDKNRILFPEIFSTLCVVM